MTAHGLPLAERFWAKVDRGESCWTWTAAHTKDGYGNIKIDGKARRAHRVAYELSVGDIPEGMDLDHLCRNRSCVNPSHLEAVTRKVNVLRGEGWTAQQARKTHCNAGHEFSEANTYTGGGARQCRRCQADGVARYASRKRSAKESS